MGATGIDDLVLAALREAPAQRLAAVLAEVDDGHQLVQATEYHGVSGWVSGVLADAGLRSPVTEPLRRAALGHVGRGMLVRDELAQVARAWDPAGIEWVVLKGPVLAEHVYSRRGGRSCVDLDLLVHPRDLRAARQALLDAGGHELWRAWSLMRVHLPGELAMTTARGTVIDLHWALGPGQGHRVAAAYDVPAMLSRRRRLSDVTDVPVPALDATDAFLHLCEHAVRSGGHLLRWALDLREAARHDEPDWVELVGRANTGGLAPFVSVALHRAATVLDLEVPPGLRGAGLWRALMAGHDRANPLGPAWRGRPSGKGAVMATRPTTAGSLVALATALGRDVSFRWRHREAPAVHQPEVLLQQLGDENDREAFLSWVESQA